MTILLNFETPAPNKKGYFTIGDVGRAHVRIQKQGFVQYLVSSTRMGVVFFIRRWRFKIQ